MMFHMPYFNFPYFNTYSRYGYRYPNSYYTYQNKKNSNVVATTGHETNHKSEIDTKNGRLIDAPTNTVNHDDEIPLFQIFGIQLFSDDLLLLALIFFLYQEGVKDQSLFIALILLLLS